MYDIQLVGNGRPTKVEGDQISVFDEDKKSAYVTIQRGGTVVFLAPLNSIMAIERIEAKLP